MTDLTSAAVDLEVTRLHLAHCSMQFNDSTSQMLSDVNKIFTRAHRRHIAWVTGTEAGAGSGRLSPILKDACADFGFRFAQRGGDDCWIALANEMFTRGTLEVFYTKIVPGKAHAHTNRGVLGVSFPNPLGHMSVLVTHLLTKGKPVDDPRLSKNLEKNKRITAEMGRQARLRGAGTNLVFGAGDMNISDRRHDTMLGAPLASAADELGGPYPNTGHGPIDGIYSYNQDGRVAAAYWTVLDDQEFSLHTDHFYCEAGFDVRHLRTLV